jgi:hypothetical protein
MVLPFPDITCGGPSCLTHDCWPCFMQALRCPGMRPRHWEQLSTELGMALAPGPGFTLATAQRMGLAAHLERLQRVAEVASKEYSIEQVGAAGR